MSKKQICACVNPKELVSDILYTALPDNYKAELDELGLTEQYLNALLQMFAAEFKRGIAAIDVEIEDLMQDKDDLIEFLAGVKKLL